MKILSFLLLFILSATGAAIAQGKSGGDVPPQNVQLDKPGDYDFYQPDVLRCIDYLKTTPLSDADSNHRKDIGSFLILWITGSPNVSLTLYSFAAENIGDQPDALLLFIAGYVEEAIRHPDAGEVSFNVAALKTVRTFYKEKRGLRSAKKLDELSAMSDVSLKSYVTAQIAKEKKAGD